jgi:hypothetical protein
MMNNIAQLKSEILRRGIAKEEDLVGCHEQDIDAVEKQYGKLPLNYKQIMRLWGGGVEKGLSIYGDDFKLARAVSLNKWMQENTFLIDENKGAIASELENVFFISGRYAEYSGGAEFIKTGENLADAIVYNIDMALSDNIDEWVDSIEIAFDSIWAWIEIDLNEKEEQLLKSKKITPKLEIEDNQSFWGKLFGK